MLFIKHLIKSICSISVGFNQQRFWFVHMRWRLGDWVHDFHWERSSSSRLKEPEMRKRFFVHFIGRYKKIFYLIFNRNDGTFSIEILSLFLCRIPERCGLKDFTYSPIKANHSREWDVRPPTIFGGQTRCDVWRAKSRSPHLPLSLCGMAGRPSYRKGGLLMTYR